MNVSSVILTENEKRVNKNESKESYLHNVENINRSRIFNLYLYIE